MVDQVLFVIFLTYKITHQFFSSPALMGIITTTIVSPPMHCTSCIDCVNIGTQFTLLFTLSITCQSVVCVNVRACQSCSHNFSLRDLKISHNKLYECIRGSQISPKNNYMSPVTDTYGNVHNGYGLAIELPHKNFSKLVTILFHVTYQAETL